MAVLSDYVSGTITLTNGSNAFTGTGTGWLAASFREGDTILGIESNAGVEYVIASITGNGAGTLTQNWEGSTGTYTYRMRYLPDGARVPAQAAQLVELLGNGNLQALAGLTGPGVPVFNGPHSMTIKPETDFINGVAYDVQVDTLADRAAYDGQSEGFTVLVSDVGDGRSALYSKVSNTPGDWSDPAYITGPIGPTSDISVGGVTTLPPGSDATVVATPVPGGVELEFGIPRGATGDLDGVTPFWQDRITADADAAAARVGLGVSKSLVGFITGLTLSNNPVDADHDIDLASGAAASDDSVPSIIELGLGITKRIDAAWSQGSGNGGRDTTPLTANSWCHVFLIYNPTSGVTDAIFSGSISTPALPAGFTSKRRIGAVLTDASANIIGFRQSGDEFRFNTPILNNSGGQWVGGSTRINIPVSSPQGAKFEVELGAIFIGSENEKFCAVIDPDKTSVSSFDFVNTVPGVAGVVNASVVRVRTNTTGQVQVWCSATTASAATAGIWTRAFFDRRDAE